MGGRKPTVPKAVLQHWAAYRERRLAEGASLWRIASELAPPSRYSVQTVYLYLNPDSQNQQRLLHTESSRRRTAKLRAHRTYLRNYRRVQRHPEHYLEQLFRSSPERNLDALAGGLPSLCEGVRFSQKALERILHQYATAQGEGRIRGPPYLEETSPGVWYYGPRPTSK